MADAIGPGSILVCKEWKEPGRWYSQRISVPKLTVGAVYKCERVHEGRRGFCPWDRCGTTGFFINGKKSEGKYIKYCPNLFRPLNDGDTSLVENEKEYTFTDYIRDTTPIKQPIKEPV